MVLMLISIFVCDNNSRTISIWSHSAASINAVKLNIQFKFHKCLMFDISSKRVIINYDYYIYKPLLFRNNAILFANDWYLEKTIAKND